MVAWLRLPSSVTTLMLAASVALWRCQKLHGDMAVVRVGGAFSARVQRVVLIACRKLFPLCAWTLLNLHQGVHRKVGGTVQAMANCRRNTAGNTLPSGHVQRAALDKAGIVLHNLSFGERGS